MEQLITFVSNNALLSGIWIGLVILIIATTIKMKLSPIKQLSPQELTFLVNRENGVVIDIRAEKEFKTSHIIDSVNFSMKKLTVMNLLALKSIKIDPLLLCVLLV